MAAQANPITIEEYLRTSYRPDVEFIDGCLEDRTGGTWDHGALRGLLAEWFLRHAKEWGITGSLGVRTRVTQTRIRLPDVVIDWAGPHPPVLVEAPLLVIEVLSEEDTYSALYKRVKDYQAMGIANIWLIDLETRTAQSCERAFWVERERLEIAGTGIYLDVPALFRALDAGEAL